MRGVVSVEGLPTARSSFGSERETRTSTGGRETDDRTPNKQSALYPASTSSIALLKFSFACAPIRVYTGCLSLKIIMLGILITLNVWDTWGFSSTFSFPTFTFPS